MSKAIDDVVHERLRQQGNEAYSPEHDDEHGDRELARAAECYVEHYIGRAWLFDPPAGDGPLKYENETMPDEWPWEEDAWKPKAPRRDLVRAAALLIAEIERLDRQASVASCAILKT